MNASFNKLALAIALTTVASSAFAADVTVTGQNQTALNSGASVDAREVDGQNATQSGAEQRLALSFATGESGAESDSVAESGSVAERGSVAESALLPAMALDAGSDNAADVDSSPSAQSEFTGDFVIETLDGDVIDMSQQSLADVTDAFATELDRSAESAAGALAELRAGVTGETDRLLGQTEATLEALQVAPEAEVDFDTAAATAAEIASELDADQVVTEMDAAGGGSLAGGLSGGLL